MTSDDVAHTNWAREHNGTGECAAFYMDFEKKAPYPCSCGYAAAMAAAREVMSADGWEQRYKPLDSPYGSLVWEYKDTLQFPPNRVWTLIDGELTDNTYVINGYHIVNRWGYAVTEVPWEPEDAYIQAIWTEAADYE